jgi:hypothetical protein
MKNLTQRTHRSLPAQLRRIALAGLALALASGCSSLSAVKGGSSKSASFVPVNHAGDKIMPAGIRRVVLLPFAGGSAASPESTALLDTMAVSVLQSQNRFEVVQMSRDECYDHFHVGSISSVSALPENLMVVIKRDYNADAVMFVDVTVYSPYGPLAVGLRAKLATVDDARLIWTFDNVFSTDNPNVKSTATRFLQSRELSGLPADLSPVSLESPTRFATYATDAMFSTLPPLVAPEGPSKNSKEAREAAIKR